MYDQPIGGIFGQYMNTFMKIKMEALDTLSDARLGKQTLLSSSAYVHTRESL